MRDHRVFWSHRLVMGKLRCRGEGPGQGRPPASLAVPLLAVPSLSFLFRIARVPCCSIPGAGGERPTPRPPGASPAPALCGVLIKGINLLCSQGCGLPINRTDRESSTTAGKTGTNHAGGAAPLAHPLLQLLGQRPSAPASLPKADVPGKGAGLCCLLGSWAPRLQTAPPGPGVVHTPGTWALFFHPRCFGRGAGWPQYSG